MHTSYLGPVLHEGYYSMYHFVRTAAYFTLVEVNREKQCYRGPPGFCVPDFGTYVEKGTRAGLPYTDGKLHFTASQSRHWTEHSVVILKNLFERKVSTLPPAGPCCCPVPTLCPCLLPALPPMPVCE